MKRKVEGLLVANVLVVLAAAVAACSDAAPGETAQEPAPTEASGPMPRPVDPAPVATAPGSSGDSPGAPVPASSCAIDTRSFFVVGGKPVESITSAGRLFNFESNGAAWANNGVDLTDVAGYASGPCRGRARGQCAFDTRTFVLVGSTLYESITAYGSYWSLSDKGEWTSQDLSLMPRYKTAGPCDGKGPGQCKFDTRTFLTEGSTQIESVTAYGKMFNYQLNGTALANNGVDLTSIARYAAGPCAGKSAGQCVFTTRVFEEVNGHVLETITAYGKIFRYAANGAAAQSEVQPSNVLLETIEPWSSGVCKK